MADIPALIERARAWAGMMKGEYSDKGEALIIDLCEALSRLTVCPLPEEVADHMKFLRTYSLHPGITDAASALERMAREIERLHERLEDNHEFRHDENGQVIRVDVPPGSIPDGIDCRDETIKLQDERNDRLAARIADLEAECVIRGLKLEAKEE